MTTNQLYQELSQEIITGEQLLSELEESVGLTWKHHEWGSNITTVIAAIDPKGVIYDHSSPVGMFYEGWNLATFDYPGVVDDERKRRNIKGFAMALGSLKSIVKIKPSPRKESKDKDKDEVENGNDIFLIHGHDNIAKQDIARFLEKTGLNVCILHEMNNSGKTIIEKFEGFSDVGFAIALLTKDDIGFSKQTPKVQKFRARQNVVFELGYFIGKIGRGKVCALVEEDVEVPSDLSGIVYILLDKNEGWKFTLIKELRAAGFELDLNKIL